MDDSVRSSLSVDDLHGDLGFLARAVAVQGAHLAWLIGAGASAMSGIPTAAQLTLRFKYELYCDANGLDVQDVDPTDAHTRRLIADFFADEQTLPPPGDEDEYAASFERAYPSPDLRADVITELCMGVPPNYGHYLLAALMSSDGLRTVFTTNFDDLIEAAAVSVFDGMTPRPSIVVADLGDPEKALRAFQKSSWPLVAKIHGDFRSDRLKNTPAELQDQDGAMRHLLREACGTFGLVVAGYSGRDKSVMAVLSDALADHASFPSGIFWCYRPTDTLAPKVVSFLHDAKTTGRTVAAVPVDNFIEMTAAIERAVTLAAPLRRLLETKRPKPIVAPTPLPTGTTLNFPVLRFNAIPITSLPLEARVLKEKRPVDLGELQGAIRTSRMRGLVARRSGGQLVAVGDEAQIAAALAPLSVTVTTESVPIDWHSADPNSPDLGLALDALTLGLGRTTGLRHVLSRRAHQVRVSDASVESLSRLKSACHGLMGTVPRTTLPWSEAVTLNLDYRVGRWWLLLVPEIWVPRGGRQTEDGTLPQTAEEHLAIADFIRERRATRYNRDVNAILDAWTRLLCGGRTAREVRTWNLVSGSGIDPVFEIVGRTAYSRPLRNITANGGVASPITERSELHGYSRLDEPLLAFDAADAAQVAVNPLVGLRDFGPFTARLSERVGGAIRIALLAPKEDLTRLRAQLNELVHRQQPRERRPYLPPWPGFERVFRIKLAPADDTAQVPLPPTMDSDLGSATSPRDYLVQVLADGVRKLSLVRDRFDVIVFYLPPRFAPLFEDRETDFDLHDEVKAVAAQLGLTTQIVTEDALTYRCRASVAWRLGTALYAKAGWVPWKLSTRELPLDTDTTYIGLSYALRTGPDGSTVFVTCCSQVFDSDGGGMEFVAYDVGQGTDPHHPFLTREDMRIVMSRSLTLYQDRHAGRSPRELVVHKQTPFREQEVAGCVDAWGTTSKLSCINITRPPWRAVSLDGPSSHGDNRTTPSYALARGTAFQLDEKSLLVWVSGNSPSGTLSGRDNYFQGSKGIPRPLLLTRDAGSGPLHQIAAQVLALSKMDWNNDALYDGLPCTIRYAQILARTIKHIPDLAPQPYDYRLFM